MVVMDVPDLQKSLGLKGTVGRWLTKIVFRILDLGEYNRLQKKNHEYTGPDFAARILEDVGVSYRIPESQLERIPKEGGFILVGNHHFGSIDGLIMEAAVGAVRPDLKILTTFLLTLIPGLRDNFIPVDNFSKGAARSRSGIRSSMEHLSGGHPLGMFPAGEVATWQNRKNRTSLGKKRIIEDIPWSPSTIKLAKRSGLPIIPIYFQGSNSLLFHLLGKIHPRLRTIRLPHEMLNKHGKVVQVRIGQPIAPADIAEMDVDSLGKYLRNRCYALESQCLPSEDPADHTWPTALADPVPANLVRDEMEALAPKALFQTGDYRVYMIRTSQAPNTMKELYRLREETFRGVGEGTGHPEDTDAYDQEYYQLILWNIPNGEIAGAYRLGDCGDLISSHGSIRGIYTASLFKYSDGVTPVLSRCLELGRSFIPQKYQREIHPLRLLLAGLAVSTLKIPKAEFYLGPVSISNDYPKFFKSLAVHFLKREYPLKDPYPFARPPHPFKPDFLAVNPDDLLIPVPPGDIDRFDRLMGALSDGKYRLPVLVRKYFTCSAKVSCFNVDPDFTDSLDGLILLRFSEFPSKLLRSILRGLPDELRDSIFMHFYGTTNP